MSAEMTFRRAAPKDAFAIVDLYMRVYNGTYSDPVMSQPRLLRPVLERGDYFWIIAESDGRLIGSVVYRYDRLNALAKVFGAVVDPEFRGHNLTEQLMTFGYDLMRADSVPAEVVYTTTRTVSPAPQKLTANLGYRKLGIFPNVHKTAGYETHCLAALYSERALQTRFTDFKLHPRVERVFSIVSRECGLPALPVATEEEMQQLREAVPETPPTLSLEAIDAPNFVNCRFEQERPSSGLQHKWYFPFHDANLLLTSPDQSVEVFCFFSKTDKHCVLIGIRDEKNIGYATILEQAAQTLHELGARYLEFIIRADEIQKIDLAIQSNFIPCAYFPSMQNCGEQRFDFVAFSRSYETLNFRNIRLDGVNREFLAQYLELWKEISLEPETLWSA